MAGWQRLSRLCISTDAGRKSRKLDSRMLGPGFVYDARGERCRLMVGRVRYRVSSNGRRTDFTFVFHLGARGISRYPSCVRTPKLIVLVTDCRKDISGGLMWHNYLNLILPEDYHQSLKILAKPLVSHETRTRIAQWKE